MQRDINILATPSLTPAGINEKVSPRWQTLLTVIVSAVIIFLAVYNLTGYPVTWFDEGSHLQVPKTLVRFGVYADHSSDGFRYYGPTVGVGPTVILPIAAVFRLFGVGLLQARLVIVLYLLLTLYAFYRLAHHLGGFWLALVAVILLVTSPGVSLLAGYGRQVLGEVPGLFFMVSGLGLWFGAWEKAGWRRLGVVGICLGLAMITKYQYLLILGPTLGIAWLTNLIYYRITPQRTFIIPGVTAVICFALWQLAMFLYLGVATASENIAALRTASAGAALIFSPALMLQNVQELVSFKMYMGWLVPVLIYGFFLALPRQRTSQLWSILFILMGVNLTWYILASVGWLRYAFPGLVIASLFVARFFYDLTDGFRLEITPLWDKLRGTARLSDNDYDDSSPTIGESTWLKDALRWALLTTLAIMIFYPLIQLTYHVVFPPFNAPATMAAYMNEHIPPETLVETWEQEMIFLTDHNYHFPPALLQNKVIGHIWLGQPSLAHFYTFVQDNWPDYILVGRYSRWVGLYPADLLAAHYELVTTIGEYELYTLKK